MKTEKGFILTAGSLFCHQNAEVLIAVVPAEKDIVVLFVKKDYEFEEMYSFLKKKEISFKPFAPRCLSEARGYFPMGFHIEKYMGSYKTDFIFNTITSYLRSKPSVSQFTDVTVY